MARKKDPTKELKDQRIPIMLSASELDAIDDWSFKHRIRSRGEAIRRLCHMAMVIEERARDIKPAADQSSEELQRRLPFRADIIEIFKEEDLAKLDSEQLIAIIHCAAKIETKVLRPLEEIFRLFDAMRTEKNAQKAISTAQTALESMKAEREAERKHFEENNLFKFSGTSADPEEK